MDSVVFYIGDIHGRSDLLQMALQKIEDVADQKGVDPVVVFLGDIVDRGKFSRVAVDLVIDTLDRWKGSQLLLGNHDDMFAQYVRAGYFDNDVIHWVRELGGTETLRSYTYEEGYGDICRFIKKRFDDHLSLFENAALSYQQGPFFACHAGVNRMRPLHEQTKFDLLWIREEFLDWANPKFAPVIHGHSVVGNLPVVTENSIGLDTGAYKSNRLSFLAVDEKERRLDFFQTFNESVIPVEPVRLNRGFGTLLDDVEKIFEKNS